MGCCTAATIDFRFRGKPLRDKLNSPLLKQSEKIPKEIVREIVEKIAVSTATLDDVLAAEWLDGGSRKDAMSPRSRGALHPSSASASPSLNVEGAGKAGWPLHPGLPRKKGLRERENHRYRR
jgi:hypothetical protein